MFLGEVNWSILSISYYSSLLLRLQTYRVETEWFCLRKVVFSYAFEVMVLMRVVLQPSLQYCRIGTMFCAQSIWLRVRNPVAYLSMQLIADSTAVAVPKPKMADGETGQGDTKASDVPLPQTLVRIPVEEQS